MISYGKHNVNQQDVDAVVDVLENQFLTQGAQVPAFEKALCDYTGANFSVSVNSGTSGLHVACLALGITTGDTVWTSPNSFAASANCALYCGAQVDFVDIDPITRNMCVLALEAKLNVVKQQNKLPKAIVVVHFAGHSCDMQKINALCKPLNISIIEDAAHGLGGSYLGNRIGACTYSDMAVLSFHPVKSITTAEGCAIMTNSSSLAERCRLFSKHGITRDENLMEGASEGPWYYEQVALGYNYRLSDLHAALGISQLKRVDSFINERRRLAANYLKKLADLPLKLPQVDALDTASWHLFMIELREHERKTIYTALHKKGVGVNVHYIPIHRHPYYQKLGFKKDQFPASERFYENALTLPLYYGLQEDEQNKVINVLHSLLG